MYPLLPLPELHFLHDPASFYPDMRGSSVIWICAPKQAGADFSSVVLSILPPPGWSGQLETQVQVCQQGRWSKFFRIAVYTDQGASSGEPQADESGVLQTDVLSLSCPAQAYRVRLVAAQPVAVCVALEPAQAQAQADACPAGSFAVPITPVSQQQLDSPQRMRLCSPCALTMALNALGQPAEALDTARQVYDHRAGIYGNWTFNTAYACRRGLQAAVVRMQRLEELGKFVSENSLLAASIAYGPGELPGAAMEQTPGHLVLVHGWSAQKILVADPAAPTAGGVLRAYEAQAFAHAWLQHKGGAGYLVRRV